jgi:hypothetical protein
MSNIHPGYRGLADIEGIGPVRFGDASLSYKQAINAPDMIMGDWDHDAYCFDKIEVGGSIGGPVTETFIAGTSGGGLWDWGVKRSTTCGTLSTKNMTLYYYCGGEYNARKFSGMLVNSLNFSCAAGDMSNFSLDLMGTGLDENGIPWPNYGWMTESPPEYTAFAFPAERIITWDKIGITITPGENAEFTPPDTIAWSNFDFNISNNLQPVYAIRDREKQNLYPFEIVPGLRTVSGTLSAYNAPQSNGKDRWDDYFAHQVSTIGFFIGDLEIDMKVRFHRVEPTSSTGPITSTIGFTGVTHQTGTAWEG